MNIEQRITAALSDETITSAAIAKLVAETEAAIAEASRAAYEARSKALDPALSPDPAAARKAMEAAQFAVERLRTLLPRLRARHANLVEAEQRASWQADFAQVEAQRDAIAAELAEVYPA